MSAGGIVYNIAKSGIMNGTIDLDTDVLMVMLLMTNTTAKTATAQDANTVGDINTLDEFDNASGYTADGTVLTSTAVTTDDASNRGELDATDVTWTSVAAGTRKIAGALLYKATGSVPIAYFSFNTSFAANGGDITINWNANGLLHVTD